MCFDNVHYRNTATFNTFIFMKRQNGGNLFLSPTILITSTTPTVLKLLDFFSHLCTTLHSVSDPEVNSKATIDHLKSAPKTPDKASKFPIHLSKVIFWYPES